MPERRVIIAAKEGLHARPAVDFAKAAAEQPITVRVAKEGKAAVDASSLLGLMTLGARHGDEVVLTADGEAADPVLDMLAGLLARGD